MIPFCLSMSGGLHCSEKPVDVIVDVIAVELSGGPEGAVTKKAN